VTDCLLDAGELASKLGVPKSWVLAEARANRIPHLRLGRYVRFREDSVREWLDGLEQGGGPWRKHKPALASDRGGS
jgi:excisionase family DNA binding protein